jgi:hypothetical protein
VFRRSFAKVGSEDPGDRALKKIQMEQIQNVEKNCLEILCTHFSHNQID